MECGDGNKKRWYEWIPSWVPICAAIVYGALQIGQYIQSNNDRLTNLEKTVQEIKVYLQSQPREGASSPFPPITLNSPPTLAGESEKIPWKTISR